MGERRAGSLPFTSPSHPPPLKWKSDTATIQNNQRTGDASCLPQSYTHTNTNTDTHRHTDTHCHRNSSIESRSPSHTLQIPAEKHPHHHTLLASPLPTQIHMHTLAQLSLVRLQPSAKANIPVVEPCCTDSTTMIS